MPIKQPPQRHGFRIPRLHPHRLRHIKRHEPFIPNRINKRRRRNALIHLRPCDPLLRQVAVLQLTAALKRLTRCASLPKVPRVERDAENDFGAGEAAGEDVVDAGLAGFAERGVDVVDVAGWREELGVVAADVGPGAGEVVAHEVQHVEEVGRGGEVNVLETVLPDGEGCGEKVVW